MPAPFPTTAAAAGPSSCPQPRDRTASSGEPGAQGPRWPLTVVGTKGGLYKEGGGCEVGGVHNKGSLHDRGIHGYMGQESRSSEWLMVGEGSVRGWGHC